MTGTQCEWCLMVQSNLRFLNYCDCMDNCVNHLHCNRNSWMNHKSECAYLLPPANEVWGKEMFSHLPVCSPGGEGGLPTGGTHPTEMLSCYSKIHCSINSSPNRNSLNNRRCGCILRLKGGKGH